MKTTATALLKLASSSASRIVGIEQSVQHGLESRVLDRTSEGECGREDPKPCFHFGESGRLRLW
jgi:hypothetical protein